MGKRAASASASPSSRSPSRSASPERAPGVVVAVDADDAAPAAGAASARKRRRTLPYEALYLAGLPDASRYYKSLMHRDTLSFVTLTPHSHFLVTASADGHVKFWKKQEVGIEFVKHYKAHTAPITAVACSADGALYASVGKDGSAKVFDVANFGEHACGGRKQLVEACRSDAGPRCAASC
jgi:peptidylprolyl isomerase domain and WD repeat-containing protein 1